MLINIGIADNVYYWVPISEVDYNEFMDCIEGISNDMHIILNCYENKLIISKHKREINNKNKDKNEDKSNEGKGGIPIRSDLIDIMSVKPNLYIGYYNGLFYNVPANMCIRKLTLIVSNFIISVPEYCNKK